MLFWRHVYRGRSLGVSSKQCGRPQNNGSNIATLLLAFEWQQLYIVFFIFFFTFFLFFFQFWASNPELVSVLAATTELNPYFFVCMQLALCISRCDNCYWLKKIFRQAWREGLAIMSRYFSCREVPSVHIGWLINAYNPHSRRTQCLWPLWASSFTWTNTYT